MNRDIGSGFYLLHDGDKELNTLKQNKVSLTNEHYTTYYSGRNAYLALLKEVTLENSIYKIWMPKYFCQNVVNNIAGNYNNVHYYDIDPFQYDNPIDISQFAKENDIVVLNNYWGLFTYSYDINTGNRPIIIEDHSHGWLSEQCINSKADYCICSVRKSYPIPVGAITWVPNSSKASGIYSEEKDEAILKAHVQINKAMALKRLFIKENDQNIKERYLSLLKNGEAQITISNGYMRPDAEIIMAIRSYFDLNPNIVKNRNLEYIGNHLIPSKHFKVIQRKGFTPFGLLLLFNDSNMFQSFKIQMIASNIYPAHLWPDNEIGGQWKYLFNIHVDFRYSFDDIQHIANTINNWSGKT